MHWCLLSKAVCRIPHTPLSEPFEALHIDLQSRLFHSGQEGQRKGMQWESKTTIPVPVLRSGRCNAVAFWVEVTHA